MRQKCLFSLRISLIARLGDVSLRVKIKRNTYMRVWRNWQFQTERRRWRIQRRFEKRRNTSVASGSAARRDCCKCHVNASAPYNTNSPSCKFRRSIKYAGMAELADALDSGSNGRKAVQVQVLLPAPRRNELRSFRFFIR